MVVNELKKLRMILKAQLYLAGGPAALRRRLGWDKYKLSHAVNCRRLRDTVTLARVLGLGDILFEDKKSYDR